MIFITKERLKILLELTENLSPDPSVHSLQNRVEKALT